MENLFEYEPKFYIKGKELEKEEYSELDKKSEIIFREQVIKLK